jgi:Holliday junction resolvase RusA-like endonuclease
METQTVFVIKNNVPSSKNSKKIVRNGNKTYLVDSDVTYKWKKATKEAWEADAEKFRSIVDQYTRPIHLGFYFVRNSNRKFDLINILQAPMDAMSKYGWFEDDNATIVIPHFLGYHVDKENPQLVIRILDQEKYKGYYEAVSEDTRKYIAEESGTLF